MLVRREAHADVTAVDALHRAAFDRDAEADLLAALRAEGDLVRPLCRVAVAAGLVVGSVVCSRATIAGADRVVGLGPVAVLPDRQGRGIGNALVHDVLGAADALDLQAVVLLGSPDLYARFGFEPAAAYGVDPPVPSWGRYFQLRPLSGWDGTLRGAFRYAPAFERLDPAAQ
ncbi:GNAT family N-acetyltransferase [Motilibacter rhizosphaerae]|uniref:GNAT family N-acetyltransferase n=1 Tax=Motilibacter rhizosphaerae TaxID=598652 RepID=UPI00102AB580|nr:N-acetyltransferase [Motilibacter rhizosphaerae]